MSERKVVIKIKYKLVKKEEIILKLIRQEALDVFEAKLLVMSLDKAIYEMEESLRKRQEKFLILE